MIQIQTTCTNLACFVEYEAVDDRVFARFVFKSDERGPLIAGAVMLFPEHFVKLSEVIEATLPLEVQEVDKFFKNRLQHGENDGEFD